MVNELAEMSLDKKNRDCHEVWHVSGDRLEVIHDEEGMGIYPDSVVIRIMNPHLHMMNPKKKYENSKEVTYEILIVEQWRYKPDDQV